MQNFNLAYQVHCHRLHSPDAVAVASENEQLSYGELAARAERIAFALGQHPSWQATNGKVPRVAILGSRSIGTCAAILGACWSGATYIPLGMKLPEDRILAILSQCKLSAIVTDEEGAKMLSPKVLAAAPPIVIAPGAAMLQAETRADVTRVDTDALPPASPCAPVLMKADDPAYIIFTSGSTGIPKGVVISAGSIHHYVTLMTASRQLGPDDRVLGVCEANFDVSLHDMFTTWRAGASLYILSAAKAMNAVRFARNSRLTAWFSVPSLAGALRQIKALKPNALPDLRLTEFGGEALTTGIVAAWRETAPNSKIVNLYGPTEATVFCMDQLVTPETAATPDRDFLPIGKPLAENAAMVVNERDEEVPDGTRGELLLSGVQLAESYLDAPELTAARFPMINGQRWYRTGDLAMRDGTGTFHFFGRIDNQVKVSGYRVELEDIDAHLRIATGIELVGTVAWPINDGVAQGIVGFVGAHTIDSSQVIAALKMRLPPYMVPNRVLAVADIPLNQSGKVDRRGLRQLLEKESA